MSEKQVEVEISLEDVLEQLTERGRQEWDLAMKRAEINALEKGLE